ncbi:MAG: ribonuclease H-like domain-containing protein [Thermoplasmatales archaeon]
MKLLFLDIETAPNVVHVWGLFNQNVATNQIVDSGYTISWAAKWHKKKKLLSSAAAIDGNENMLRSVHALLEEADVVVTYNGSRFDLPTLNKEFIKHGLTPPATYKQIDLLKTARSQFKFASNKLDYVAQFLGLGCKVKHKGHDLWKEVMNGDMGSVKKMLAYNKQDVILLEQVYEVMKPWIKNHPNMSVYNGELVCPHCGSKHYQRRGFAYTAAGKYQRFTCLNCFTWFRANKAEKGAGEKFLPVQ